MQREPVYERISVSDIGLIKPLWEKLRIIHLHDSVYFKEFYERFTFETRTEKFAGLGDDRLRVEIVKAGGAVIGYCVSTAEGAAGEIDSIYIEESHRGGGIGETLVKNALDWFGKEAYRGSRHRWPTDMSLCSRSTENSTSSPGSPCSRGRDDGCCEQLIKNRRALARARDTLSGENAVPGHVNYSCKQFRLIIA